MADIATYKIQFKSDFVLTIHGDAGWTTPFCIKFWTGDPSRGYFVGWDGKEFINCKVDETDASRLIVLFDDHGLPVGQLKMQMAWHTTIADFPHARFDEVMNQMDVVATVEGEEKHVELAFEGETAPEVEYFLPAYANEAQRIANEEQRIENEQTRITNEQQRIANEDARISAEATRQAHELQRIHNEEARIAEFAQLKADAIAATDAANTAASLAQAAATLASDKAALSQAAATLANEKAALAADKAALAQAAATLANDKAALAQQKAAYAQAQGDYAKAQGDYAKAQGDYAKEQGDTAQADHERAEADHTQAATDHTTAQSDHTQAATDHATAAADHTTATQDHAQMNDLVNRADADHAQAATDHTQAQADHTRAESDHTTAASDHSRAEADHTTAAADHETASSDHTRAEIDHAAVEVYVDSLGAFDISSYHATGGVLAKYADLTAALGTNGANIPEGIRKGGMSVKFVLSSDNKYVQYRLMSSDWSTEAASWAVCDEGVYIDNPEFIRVILDKDKRVLASIKKNGEIEWSKGIPTPVKEYIQQRIGVAYSELDANKVDKEYGKSLIDAKYAESSGSNDREKNYANVELDKDKSFVSCMTRGGKKIHYTENIFKGGVDVSSLKIQGKDSFTYIRQGEEHDYNDYAIDYTLENGIFNGTGGNYAYNSGIRTEKMSASADYMYAVIFPNTLNCGGNFDGSGSNYIFNAPFSFRGSSISSFYRLYFVRKDSSNPLQIENLTTEERAAIKILKVPYIISEWDVFIARNNSPEYVRKNATMTVDEANSQSVLQAFIGCLNTIRLRLNGYFYLNTNHVINTSGQVCALNTRQYRILEDYQTVYIQGGYIEETVTLHSLWNNENENSIFCCPRKAVAKNTGTYIWTYIEMHNVSFRCYYYDKALTCIDTTQAWNTRFDSLSVRGTTIEPATGNGTPFKITPHSEYVGIRASHGSNGGTNDWIKHTFVVYFNKAFSINGEHFVIEDCLAHHNYIGFAFGDYETGGHFEHPNIMIGCSIEACYRLMLLTKNGATEESQFVPDSSNNLLYSTLRCIGLSTEQKWTIPTDEQIEGEETTMRTKPILEILKGAYRGEIEADYVNYPFENGSGTHMRWVTYNGDKTYIGYSNVCEKTIE